MKFKTILAAFATSAVMATGASAALIDFTDTGVWSGADGGATTSATYGSLTVSLTSNPLNKLDFSQSFDGSGASDYCIGNGGLLACNSDGLGVGGDEITNQDNTQNPPLQSVTVSFSGPGVFLKRAFFLDLFQDPTSANSETVLVYKNGDRTTEVSYSSVEEFQVNGGFGADSTIFAGELITSLTWFTDTTNDGQGGPDYALAGLEVEVVPLPAAGWMLLAGLGGLVAMRRKKSM